MEDIRRVLSICVVEIKGMVETIVRERKPALEITKHQEPMQICLV